MLSQSPSLPGFMGTLSFCVEQAVKEVGGEENIFDGDIIIYNNPYGSVLIHRMLHLLSQFYRKQTNWIHAIKAHWLDTGGKEPYSTDTVDVFQEGTIYPGLKLYKRGELVEDIYKLIIANTRVPKAIVGDLNAQLNGVIAGASALKRIVNKFGYDLFYNSVIEIYNHGEKLVRKSLKKIPNGTYSGFGQMDSNGVDEGTVKFKISIEVKRFRFNSRFYRCTRSTKWTNQLSSTINCF